MGTHEKLLIIDDQRILKIGNNQMKTNKILLDRHDKILDSKLKIFEPDS